MFDADPVFTDWAAAVALVIVLAFLAGEVLGHFL